MMPNKSKSHLSSLNVLELFSGTKSISEAFRKKGHSTFTVDNNSSLMPDLCIDIGRFSISDLPFSPHVIWASPPCTCFSVASIGRHWRRGEMSNEAKQSIKLLVKTFEIIILSRPVFWFVENPRGMMRKLPILDALKKHTVTYCQYGDSRMKPTDIWTNCNIWNPKPACKNGDSCHISSPRGSRSGTQGLKNAIERSKIPQKLCDEIVASCEASIIN